jgi:hypothetical protein
MIRCFNVSKGKNVRNMRVLRGLGEPIAEHQHVSQVPQDKGLYDSRSLDTTLGRNLKLLEVPALHDLTAC